MKNCTSTHRYILSIEKRAVHSQLHSVSKSSNNYFDGGPKRKEARILASF